VIPHSGQHQVDQVTGAVRHFQALPGPSSAMTPTCRGCTEDYWDGRVAWSRPLLDGEA
jgi:hypothetical protein